MYSCGVEEDIFKVGNRRVMLLYIKRTLYSLYFKYFFLKRKRYRQNKLLTTIRQKGQVNVVFFASVPSMWRYQGVYELMSKDKRFVTTIILTWFRTFSKEQNNENIKKLRDFFDSRNIPYKDSTLWSEEEFDIRKWLKPDILFYLQPYGKTFGNRLDSEFFYDKLLCYVPYGVGSFSTNWMINTSFQNFAWKLFYESEAYKKIAVDNTYNNGENIAVVGDANADEFLNSNHQDVWKKQASNKKRVIWAPHFTIEPEQKLHRGRGTFIALYDVMLTIAEAYRDKIQFAFKPHPRLRSALYQNAEWGKKKTDEYYEKWDAMPNTQLEESSFVDLFMSSDALIHDCGSFTVEYHYSKKPCMFFTDDLQGIREPLNELGRAALDVHYIGWAEKDIRSFLDRVVLGGEDEKKQAREAFFRKYLLPPNGKSVAQNIYDDIVQSIWGK